MRRKIFNSDDSRTKHDLDLKFKFYSWWLRSRSVDRKFYHYLGYVDFINHINSLGSECYASILPACTI